MARNEYRLVRGGVVLGVITHTTDDQPHHVGQFAPWPAFAAVRPLFEKEIDILESQGESAAWRQVREQIDMPGLLLEPHEWVGNTIVRPLLHVRGEEVWWR